jgi:hypothetical protein
VPARREGHPGGKLKAAARRWAGGRGGPDVPAGDALTASAPLPRHRLPSSDEEIELPGEDAAVVGLFFALDTQWRRHPMTGVRLGIDYAAIGPTAQMLEIDVTPQLLPRLRIMESAALEVLAERA